MAPHSPRAAESKLVIFDYSGTIVDSRAPFFAALNSALVRAGLPRMRGEEEFVSLFSGNFYDGLRERYPRLKGDGALLKRIVADFKAGKAKEEDRLPIVAGMPQALRRLRDAGATLAIVTAASEENVMRVLSARGVMEFFSFVLGSETGQSKTDKILKVMERMPLPRERIYYVGDTAGDVREAKACGIRTVAVLWGYHKEADFRPAYPEIMIDRPDELVQAIY